MSNRLMLSIAMTLVLGASAFAQTTYTSRSEFDSAISGYSVQHAVNFDSQADGSSASYFGKLSMWGNGLGSDGSTNIGLSPVATSAYQPSSTPNSLGPDDIGRQFLSGNSDSITFYFSGPVHAFGLYLIGDPSPTGSPAIPFWKMNINTTNGYDALSATDPTDNLGPGNDRYFLGVTSTEPFAMVTLYSDNDPDAVFSFNVDDIRYATNAQAVSLLQAKSLAAGTMIKLSDVVVTRVHSSMLNSRFYVETTDRLAGLAVLGSPGVSRNQAVDFVGTLTMTPDNEFAVTLGEILSQTDSAAPGSLGMSARSLGGATTKGNQVGLADSVGPNNIGLDVTIWGKITEVHYDPYPYGPGSWIIVDDGTGRPCGDTAKTGVKVVGAVKADSRQEGQFITAQGSSSLWKASDNKLYPLVRVAQSGDVSP